MDVMVGLAELPVCVVCFDRPDSVMRCLRALIESAGNRYKLKIYVFSDGPKTESQEAVIKNVRDVLNAFRTRNPFIEVINRPRNVGLAENVTKGMSFVLSKHPFALCLEDDVIVSAEAIDFTVFCLTKYQADPSVMHVNLWNWEVFRDFYPADSPTRYFKRSGGMHCWGWATWSNSWSCFNNESRATLQRLTFEKYALLDFDGAWSVSSHLFGNLIGVRNTWAVYWAASIVANEGLVIYPIKPLVKNIGVEGGSHPVNQKYSSLFKERRMTVCSDNIDKALPKPLEIDSYERENILYFEKMCIRNLTGVAFHVKRIIKIILMLLIGRFLMFSRRGA